MAYIELENISKSFHGKEVISNLSLEMEKNIILGILGPSGSGKTTLLRILAGLEVPDKGRISIDGKDIFNSKKKIETPPEKRNLALVFQDFALWPHLTVEKHLKFVLKARKVSSTEHKSLIRTYLKLLQMEEKAHSYPQELSGGEKQRVALARALAQEPRVLLLDEPFSNLDQILKNDFKRELKRLQKKFSITMLYVTHNYLDLIDVANKIAVMKDGKIIQQGTPQELSHKPKNKLIAKILGRG